MMSPSHVRAVTFDFWNTLFSDVTEPARHHRRLQCFHDVLAQRSMHAIPFDDITRAFRDAFTYANETWKRDHRTVSSRERIRHAMRTLAITLPDGDVDAVTRFFEDVLLDDPPALLPGVRDTVSKLTARFPLGIISDTGYSPGTTLRRLLEHSGIADYFSVHVFSDETGYAKPDPKAFHVALDTLGEDPQHVLHIGDIERTDVAGAQGVGMNAALYTGGAPRRDSPPDTSAADIVLMHHTDVLTRLHVD